MDNKKGKKDLTFEISVLELSNYVRPDIKENSSKEWVTYGKNNYFFSYIEDRNSGSPTNASINKSYADLIYGRGIYAKNAHSNISDWVRFREIISEEDIRKIITDFQVYGSALIQVIETKVGKDLAQMAHVPRNQGCPGKIIKGAIYTYWISNDFSRPIGDNTPKAIPAFSEKNQPTQIFEIKPYSPGKKYFADPDYISGMQYCEMEEEISNLYIRSIKQGLIAGYIINVPNASSWTAEEKDQFRKDIVSKLTGTNNASQFVLSFNGRDVEITITPFPVNDSVHKQWEVINEQAGQKILTAHRATSPSIVGIVSSSGFSNTADEMDVAEEQLVKRVIRPKQDYILGAFDKILTKYGYNLDLAFRPLTEAQTEMSLSKEITDSDIELFKVIDSYAQDAPEGYEEHIEEVDEVTLSAIQKSEQDSADGFWKIRYRYAYGTNKTPKGETRAFCLRMMALSAMGKVFRKEDIDAMSESGVNGQFAHSGGKYDIFLFGGGVNCHHRWERAIFKKKKQEDGSPYIGNAMQNTFPVNVNEARRQGAPIPVNDKDVAKAEIDKPNKGRYNG